MMYYVVFSEDGRPVAKCVNDVDAEIRAYQIGGYWKPIYIEKK